MPTDPKAILTAILWLAALGAVALLAGRVLTKTAAKASSAV